VFGEGNPRPRLVVVGEAPGAEEDATGRPFVGAAGKLLTKMLAAIGLAREDVYICNLLKCRPPGNRDPRPDEVASCKPYLRAQIEALAPELILALGSPATRELLRTERGITSLRGRVARSPEGWRVLPSYHPAYLLRHAPAKREAWEDLQKVARELGLEVPRPTPASASPVPSPESRRDAGG
jgi:DNA polymerase